MNQEQPEIHSKKRIGILLFHGLTGMPSELRPLARFLRSQGFEVDTPLIEGHGSTHQDLLKTTWKDWVKGAEVSLAEMRKTCDEIYVGGLSMGAVLATALAIRHPDIKGLLLLSPHLGILQENLQSTQCLLPIGYYLKPLHSLCYWSEKAPFGLKDERLQRKIEQALNGSKEGQTSQYGLYRTYIGSIYQMLDLIHFCKKHAKQVQCPTLILQSLEDTITKTENATLIYSSLNSPVKYIRMFTGCNHVMSVDLRKTDVARWMVQFIQKQSNHTHPEAIIDKNTKSHSISIDFDQLHVDIISQNPSSGKEHQIVVRMGEKPVLIWPIVESRKNPFIEFLKHTISFSVGFPQKMIPEFYMDPDIPHIVMKQACRRAWIALKALHKTQKKNLTVCMNHDPEKEVLRTLWQQNGFAQMPSKSSLDEVLPAWALWHPNLIIQTGLLILSFWHWQQKVAKTILPSNRHQSPKQNILPVPTTVEFSKRAN